MDSAAYQEYLKNKAITEASACKRCGTCCGANNDPCMHLVRGKDGLYNCLVYEDRLGPRRTVSGNIFICIPIKDHIRSGFAHPGCAFLS